MSFHRHQTPPDLPSVSMDGVDLEESSCLDKLLGLKCASDLKWNAYVACVAMEAARMVGSFYRSRKYLTPHALLYLYKSEIRLRMEYCCHLWAGCSQQALSLLDRIQSRMRGLVGDELFASLPPLSHRRNVASLSLFYRYFQGKCSEELHSLVPKKHEFTIYKSISVYIFHSIDNFIKRRKITLEIISKILCFLFLNRLSND